MPSQQPPFPTLTMRYGASAVHFGAGMGGMELHLPMPVLAGSPFENIPLSPVVGYENSAALSLLWCDDGSAVGIVEAKSTGPELESGAYEAFSRFLEKTPGLHLYRVWNFLPEINRWNGDLENYHRFNRGRWQAFNQHWASNTKGCIPAASAVGYQADSMVSVFLAGKAPATHVENPLQVPAWQYPSQYGPQSPSFSRGTSAPWCQNPKAWFISGTASIRGHETLAAGNVVEQCRITLENLEKVVAELDLPPLLSVANAAAAGAESPPAWMAKIYLRQAADLPAVQESLISLGAQRLWERSTTVLADICRADLAVEIEITCP